ncbi:DUF222 domain-containing protein [Arthrobacter mobilis]|uniref:DUF222 domain-containing protein n=1 Tax=Arthrobacter mobilis TaxID=2724944 RepID=A0A7X6K6W3_9MICC|nr:DUF222 domain-containing protein [Arthrobacter mobilis]NKX56135.1 DUF222 domain-containing protein [Arthrobacter mobilis]
MPADPWADCPEVYPGPGLQDDEAPDAGVSADDDERSSLPADLATGTSLPAAAPEQPWQLLAAMVPEQLGYPEAARYLEAARRAGAWLEACTARLAHRLLDRALAEQPAVFGPDVPDRARTSAGDLAGLSAAAELAGLLRISEGTARARLDQARQLCTRYPATLAALEAGQITRAQAGVILDQAAGLSPQARTQLEVLLLAAAGLDVPGLRRKARRIRERHGPGVPFRAPGPCRGGPGRGPAARS